MVISELLVLGAWGTKNIPAGASKNSTAKQREIETTILTQ